MKYKKSGATSKSNRYGYYTDDYWKCIAQSKELEKAGTEFLRERGYDEFGKKLPRRTA